MKYSVFFVLLSLFVCLAYSQETCEQALNKYNVDVVPKTQPKDKCLVLPSFLFHLSENGKALTQPSPNDLKKVVGDAADKTCADTKECTDSYAVAAYKEIDTACGAEITKGSSIGSKA